MNGVSLVLSWFCKSFTRNSCAFRNRKSLSSASVVHLASWEERCQKLWHQICWRFQINLQLSDWAGAGSCMGHLDVAKVWNRQDLGGQEFISSTAKVGRYIYGPVGTSTSACNLLSELNQDIGLWSDCKFGCLSFKIFLLTARNGSRVWIVRTCMSHLTSCTVTVTV